MKVCLCCLQGPIDHELNLDEKVQLRRAQQVSRADAKRSSDSVYIVDTDIALGPLYSPDICTVKARPFGQVFL